ncbi:MAG: hypothetical protein J2P17_18915 [Mycobacterium sp.]|nr:hypothetical protein [Mycobacterium sp.]
MFRQRAALACHPVTEPGQVALAEQVCGHMHGNPLCIRLAAARMFYEPLPMIVEQFSGESDDMRMQWHHGPRVGLERWHRAIGDVIARSYELCGDKQRLLFDRLSVFAPGYDVNPEDAGTGVVGVGAELEAIEVVCADDVPIPGCEDLPSADRGDQAAIHLARNEIRELLERLVEQSLVSVHMAADTVTHATTSFVSSQRTSAVGFPRTIRHSAPRAETNHDPFIPGRGTDVRPLTDLRWAAGARDSGCRSVS